MTATPQAPAAREDGLVCCSLCNLPQDEEDLEEHNEQHWCPEHTGKQVIALDTETYLIGGDSFPPKLVCIQVFDGEQSAGWSTGDDDLEPAIRELLQSGDAVFVGHNIAFDMLVIASAFPDMLPLIFALYSEGRVLDTGIREKLLNLRTHGRLSKIELPDGSSKKISYALGNLVLNRLGIDILESKSKKTPKGEPEPWRLRYAELDGVAFEEFPKEAREYALEDAELTFRVFQDQEGSPTEAFQTRSAFALALMGATGMVVDGEKVQEIRSMLEKQLSPRKLKPLMASGILRPAVPSRPYKNNPDKFTQDKPASINKKKLMGLVEGVCEDLGYKPALTETGRTSTSDDFITALVNALHVREDTGEDYDLLVLYQHRQKLQKLVTTEIPRIAGASDLGVPLRTRYDVLKETGRTSARRDTLLPSWNVQNVDPRVRGCIVAPEGMVLCSVDYSAIELCTLAQTTADMFGAENCKLLELINSGGDPHAFLGSALAYNLDAEFRDYSSDFKAPTYEVFLTLKTEGEAAEAKFYKHYRKFAKPVGLGFPGGLGAETFVAFAKGTYGVEVTAIQAKQLKQIWLETFPEMKRYLAHAGDYAEIGYESPLGMIRVGTSYTSWANGKALQTPAAEGGKTAAFDIVRACWDSSGLRNEILYGCLPVAFIHDEFLVYVEEARAHEQAMEISRLMERGMKRVCPDVVIKCEACLMHRWDKLAEPAHDKQGKLIPWDS